jgi:hypothetical protein
MPILNPTKALRSLRKTPVILDALIGDLTQAQAVAATDGPDGWSVLEIVCHLADLEVIFSERARLLLENDHPHFPNVDQLALVQANDYAGQDVHEMFKRYLARRRKFITFLEGLDDVGWAREGEHPETGDTTLVTLAINTALHDVNHIEQIASALAVSDVVV